MFFFVIVNIFFSLLFGILWKTELYEEVTFFYFTYFIQNFFYTECVHLAGAQVVITSVRRIVCNNLGTTVLSPLSQKQRYT
jgi:hypothetical protein